MKPHHLQFDARENTASSRQHASRPVVCSSLSRQRRGSPPSYQDENAAPHESLVLETLGRSITETPNEATGGEKRENSHLLTVHDVAELLQVPISWVYVHSRPRCINPLPCIKLGKYLRFRSTEIANYLRSTSAN